MHDLIDIFSKVWCIEPNYVRAMLPHFFAYMNGQDVAHVRSFFDFEKREPYNIEKLKQFKADNASKVPLTVDYSSNDLAPLTVAYYPAEGVILSSPSNWRFSTINFVRDFQAAERNPNISAHFIAAQTPGGDAYYLDKAVQVLEKATKPIVTHARQMLASAGIYLASPSTRIYMDTDLDQVGSVGTMFSYLDMEGIFEKLGAKNYEVYATESDMKNSLFRALKQGETDTIQKEWLDVYNESFISAVKNNFPELNQSAEVGALRGKTFFAKNDPGFIDGIISRAEALNIAYELGRNSKMKQLI